MTETFTLLHIETSERKTSPVLLETVLPAWFVDLRCPVFKSLCSGSTRLAADDFLTGFFFFHLQRISQSSATSQRRHSCSVTVRRSGTPDWLGDFTAQTCIVELHPLIKQLIIQIDTQRALTTKT